MAESFGCEELIREFQFLDNVIRNKGQYQNAYLNGRGFIQIFRSLLQKIMCCRNAYLSITEQEPMFQKSLMDAEFEFGPENLGGLMTLLRKELSAMKDLKSEEVQKARAKERSTANWSKVKDSYTKKFLLKINIKEQKEHIVQQL
mmetsp:Transcript_27770/g.20835  ORF Transcript_27770/g.20835 Transcript_27770/m.20835 type:complete len:145 (+) Transcript_27770:823-1257(+)